MSEENIEIKTKSGSNLATTFADHHVVSGVNFKGHCLINNNGSIPKNLINLYISYILNPWLRNLNIDFTLNNYLFGSVSLTKNPDQDKYKYSGYGVGFDCRSEFLLTDQSMGKNVIIFGADMTSSENIDNKNKDILILGEGPTQGLDDTTLKTEAKHPINFTQPRRRFVLSLHYNESNRFLFVNATKIYQFKAKDSITINNMKKKQD